MGSWVFATKGHVSARAQPPLLVEAPGAASQLANGLCLQHIITHTHTEITDKYIIISSVILYHIYCISCYIIAHSAIELISLMIIRFMFGCQDQLTSLKWLALTGRSCACVGRMARRAPWRQRLPRRWARRDDAKRVAVGRCMGQIHVYIGIWWYILHIYG